MPQRLVTVYGAILALLAAALVTTAAGTSASASETAPGARDVEIPASDYGRVDGTESAAPKWTSRTDEVPFSEVQARAEMEGVTTDEAQRRFNVEAAAAELQVVAAERYEGTFAGLWLTQQPFGVTVAFTRDEQESVRNLAAGFSYGDLLKAERRTHALPYLLDKLEQIGRDREAIRSGGAKDAPPSLIATGGNYDVGIDIRANEVTVHVQAPDTVRADLVAAYGPAVTPREGVAEPADCATFNCGTTMMSGLQLEQSNGVCSSAFTAYTSSYRYVLSAGHCYTILGNRTARYHNWSLYGHTDRYGFSGNVDAERIRRTTSFRESSKYVTNNSDPISVSSYAAQANVAVGTFIGKTGRTTGTTRGYVTDQYFDPGYVTGVGDRFFVADLCSDQGDSGSGVWRGGATYGVLSGGWDNQQCRNANGSLVNLSGAGPKVINGMDSVLSGMQVSLLYNLNLPPVASFTDSCSPLLQCSFNGYGSDDPDGSVRQWYWNFGDGNTGSGPYVSHSYLLPGVYTVQLTVYDNNGAAHTTSRQLTVL